ncbi:MAG: PKD domain-containing protein [Bacteroidia bacterium]|nr:PKD domain-containing protein [Bacteroidia bacterium]
MAFDSASGCQSYVCHDIQIGNISTGGMCYPEFSFYIDQTTNTVYFNNESMNGDFTLSCYWTFGDGSFTDSINPVHHYQGDGFYNVCLYIDNQLNGCYGHVCHNIQIGDIINTNMCFAEFSFFIDPASNTVSFNDESLGNFTSWYWSFGDGGFSEQQNPVYQYSAPGFYHLCMFIKDTVAGCMTEVCHDIQIGDAIASGFCSAGYYLNPGYYYVGLTVFNNNTGCSAFYGQEIQVGTMNCNAGFEFYVDALTNFVSFEDISFGNTNSWFWDFGDGNYAFEQNPAHQYFNTGMYFVCLTIHDTATGCFDEYCREVHVGTINCNAHFTTFVDSVNNIAHFHNDILGPATLLYWEFGDGASSTVLNPSHYYPAPGFYLVSLNTYNNATGCMDYYEEFVLIGSQGIDCQAKFTFQADWTTDDVFFFNQSITGNAPVLYWNFGDGTVSGEENPVHHYIQSGFYNVCLTVYDNISGCQNTFCKLVQLGADPSFCHAYYIYTVDSTNLEVSFIDNSYGAPSEWLWDFGDGTVDSVQNPVHIFPAPGYYPVQLFILNPVTGCQSHYIDMLNIAAGDNGLQAVFGYDVDSINLKTNEYSVDFVGAAFGEPAFVDWDFGDGGLDSNTYTPTHIYNDEGTYWVCFTVSDPVTGDTDTYCDSVDVYGPSGFQYADIKKIFMRVYPNPFTRNATVIYRISQPANVEISVYDVTGKKINTLFSGYSMDGTYSIRNSLLK